jgi:hypothetical protein
MKQARAHGLGLVLSTQNPVDLDYKTMSNAGTWMVGRLQTERDKARILEALESATGAVDPAAYGALIGALESRQFLLQTSRSPEPTLFTSRWAMSYLRGALTRDEVRRLMGAWTADPRSVAGAGGASSGPGTVALGQDESPVAPVIADSTRVVYMDPGAPWANQIGAQAGSSRLQAGVAARVALTFDDRSAGVDHREVWEAIVFPVPERFDPDALKQVDFDDRDWSGAPPPEARYVIGGPDLRASAWFRDFERDLKEHLYHHRRMLIYRNREVDAYSRVGETKEDFQARCESLAGDRADEDIAKLQDRYRTRILRVKDQLASAEHRVRELEVDVSSRRTVEAASVAGDLLSMFLGGRRRSRSLRGYASRRSTTRRTQERLTTAEDKVADRTGEMEELEKDLAHEIVVLTGAWDAKATQVEEMEIDLDKSDIHVEDVILFWAPVASD